jgi:hypothetical protein
LPLITKFKGTVPDDSITAVCATDVPFEVTPVLSNTNLRDPLSISPNFSTNNLRVSQLIVERLLPSPIITVPLILTLSI